MELDKKTQKNLMVIVLMSIVFYFLIKNISEVIEAIEILLNLFFPFLLGGAIAFVLHVPMKVIEEKWFKHWKKYEKLKRPLACLITILLVIGIIFLALFVVIPELIATLNILIEQVPQAFDKVVSYIIGLEKYLPQLEAITVDLNVNWEKAVQEAMYVMQNALSGIFSSTIGIVSGIVNGVMSFFIGFVFAIYILFQKENLSRQVKKLLYAVLPIKIADKTVYIGKLSLNIFSNFLSGQCCEAIILGFMFFVAMSIFKMPYAILIGILIAIMALIPIFGAFIGLAVGFFLIVMVNPLQAFGFVILFLVLQQIEGNLIYPYVVGGTVGLPSIWVLFAVTIGGKVMGVAGMLLFIPLCSVVYSLLREFVQDKVKQKKIPFGKW